MDIGVGSIVWVRRRNGSWWPGQILCPDDLSASHLTSPRSGTPVKLLGREDASVDWYNLEKSKRVKAFRCGEFDDCIEKAESCEGMPLKKREKYARREDAILHALELERLLLKKEKKVGVTPDQTDCRLSSTVKNGVVMLPVETLVKDNEKYANLKSYVSGGNEIAGGPFPSEVVRDGHQLSGEVDPSGATPRTRGLQVFELEIVPFEGKLSSPVDHPNVAQKPSVDEGAQTLASGSLSARSALHTNGAEQIACRAKRSRCVYFPDEFNDSLDYKEGLAHVEMSSPQLRREFPYHGSFVGETESTFMDVVESDSSETVSADSESDSSETEPDMDEEMMTILTETGQDVDEHESTSSEEPDELAVTSDMPHLYPRDLIMHNEPMSKWQLKGKRNNRNLVKRSFGAPDGKGIIYGAEAGFVEGRRTNSSHKRMGLSLHCYKNDFSDAIDDDDQMFDLEEEYSLTPRAVPKSQYKMHHDAVWNDWAWDEHLPSKEYWDDKGFTTICGDRHHFGGRMGSMLVDVDLKVQASYRKEPVPIISLMSRLDGKAIIGHPIQVEALKDGSSDIFFSAIDDISNDDGIGNEGSSVLPQAWRTARRTANVRIPRPHVLTSNGAEVAAEFLSLDQEQNLDYKKLSAGSSSHKASLQKKSGPKSHGSSPDKKSLRKVPKKLTLSSNQKVRTLSSLSTEHSLSRNNSSYQSDRLTKPEISGPTTVACIPVQLVFSRLLEKINRPPLKASK